MDESPPELYAMIPRVDRPAPREEAAIFADLSTLCATPGYAHVIAFLCFRDDFMHVPMDEEAELPDSVRPKSPLIRTEISTLIGLLVKKELNLTLPDVATRERQTVVTDELLQELHDAMTRQVAETVLHGETPAPLTAGRALREPVFYGPESAYAFQYLDFSETRYKRDEDWMRRTMGFTPGDARRCVAALGKLQERKVQGAMEALRAVAPEAWTLLPGFVYSSREVADETRLDEARVAAVLRAFSVPATERNQGFLAVGDFNVVNARPIIPLPGGEFILYQYTSLAEALYESPFFWMHDDVQYRATAMANRGAFTEELCAERLTAVFGTARVHRSLRLVERKGSEAAELDVLVAFADRAVVVQAKSKRMTIEARKGNDLRIQEDFGKSVGDAFEQGQLCSQLLRDPRVRLQDVTGAEVRVRRDFREIYVLCVVADHYPALALQAREFLRDESEAAGVYSLVSDVFLLDVMAEMLDSPLRFLSYLGRRARYGARVHSNHELAILGYHLSQNLWIEDKMNLVSLDDAVAADLDAAMRVRREGASGSRTPEGILTRLQGTTLGRLVDKIEHADDPGLVSLGFMLLALSEDTFLDLSQGIDEMIARCLRDGAPHDLSIDIGSAGITVHCNNLPDDVAARKLQAHCALRKYASRAGHWLGLCLHPGGGELRMGCELEFDWEQSDRMDEAAGKLGRKSDARGAQSMQVGRNDPCPCGSGRKFKKCCGHPGAE